MSSSHTHLWAGASFARRPRLPRAPDGRPTDTRGYGYTAPACSDNNDPYLSSLYQRCRRQQLVPELLSPRPSSYTSSPPPTGRPPGLAIPRSFGSCRHWATTYWRTLASRFRQLGGVRLRNSNYQPSAAGQTRIRCPAPPLLNSSPLNHPRSSMRSEAIRSAQFA